MYTRAFLAEMQGHELEDAYAKAFFGKAIGGIRDGGVDVLTGDESVPYVQVKSSIASVITFLADSVRFKRFIPVCVGEPGKREEMIESLLKFGIWVGTDIPDRTEILTAVTKVRTLCSA